MKKETIKFFSKKFNQIIKAEVLEKRRFTWKIKTPKATLFANRYIKKKIKDKFTGIPKQIQILKKFKIKVEEKIIIKRINQLNFGS